MKKLWLLLLFPVAGWSGLVQSASCAPAATSNIISCAFSGPPALGNTITFGVQDSGLVVAVVSDNYGNTYTNLVTGSSSIFYGAIVTSTGGSFTVSATFSGGSGSLAASMAEYSGMAASISIDVTTNTTSTSTSATVGCGTLTTTSVSDNIVAFVAGNNAGDFTGAGGGATLETHAASGPIVLSVGLIDDLGVGVGSYSPTATLNNGGSSFFHQCLAAALRNPSGKTIRVSQN